MLSEPLLTPDDLSRLIGVPKATLYQWRSKGEGPRAIRCGRHLRYARVDVEAWLEARASEGRPST